MDGTDRVIRGSFTARESCFFFFSALSFVLKFNPRMGQEGDVQRGGFRLDGPVTSRDKVDRLCLLGSWWYTRAPSLRCGFASISRSLSLPLSLSLSLSPSVLPSLHPSCFGVSFIPLSSVSLFLTRRTSLEDSAFSKSRDRITKLPPVSRYFVFPSLPARIFHPHQNRRAAEIYNGPMADARNTRRTKEKRLHKIAK